MRHCKYEFTTKEGKVLRTESVIPDENVKMYDNLEAFIDHETNTTYVYTIGGTKLWKSIGCVLCAEKVELASIKMDVTFS